MAKSIIQREKECLVCRMEADQMGYYGELPHTGLHKHHIFMGNRNRKWSEKYGLWCYLCVSHHEYGPNAVHSNRGFQILLMQIGQQVFERTRSREEFRAIFGKSWMDEEICGYARELSRDWWPPQEKQTRKDLENEIEFIDTGIGELPF